jgi:hypothetical protein
MHVDLVECCEHESVSTGTATERAITATAARRLTTLGTVLALLLLAGVLRFIGLGAWPFANDELATFLEERSLFSASDADPASQIHRLPRIVPLAYGLHHVGTSLFGSDEFGSRVVMALLGTLSVAAVFLALDRLQGRPTALIAALLVAFWPEHLFQSQQTRFYITAAFFSTACLGAGAWALALRSLAWTLVACLLALAALLCHTLTGILFPMLLCATLAGYRARHESMPRPILLAMLVTMGLIGLLALVYLWPLLHGWNAVAPARYSVAHSILASLNSLGWPVALLAAAGLLFSLRRRTSQDWYWGVCTLGWIASCIVLPLVVVYHAEYRFPLAFTALVTAAALAGNLYAHLRRNGRWVAAAWLAAVCLMNFPSLVSHYADGDRIDVRTAARYVQDHWRPGDRVVGTEMTAVMFRHYAPQCTPVAVVPTNNPLPELRQAVLPEQRTWILLQSWREGLPDDVRRWLGRNTSHESTVRRKRYDYAEYCVDVFLRQP